MSTTPISIALTIMFVINALTNVVFTSFVAYEQITMFYQELRNKEESMRVERYLAIKDRPLSGFFLNESQLRVELTYPSDVMRKGKTVTMIVLLVLNTIIVMIPFPSTQIIVTLVGAFTTPLVIFILPGYLFYDQQRKSETNELNKYLSFGLTFIGVLLLVVMTTISIYVIRIELFKGKPAASENMEL